MAAAVLPRKLNDISEKKSDYPGKSNGENHFDLLRSFALTSLVVMLIIGGISGVVFSNYLSESLLRRDAEVSQAFARSLTEVEGGTGMFLQEPEEAVSGANSQYDLPELGDHIATTPGVVRTNIYSREGVILWSSQQGFVGRKFSENHELEKALKGEIVFEIKSILEEEKAEYANFGIEVSRVVENYLPIEDENGAVVAVVEMYKAPKRLFEEIESARNLVWVSVATAVVFLYACLFWIIFRANRVIRDQQLRLVESETMVAIGEMASTVAHSIRNPLAVMRSSAELTGEISKDAAIRESSEDIITQIDRVELWLRELLTYSRSEGMTQILNADLAEIIRHCIQGHKQTIRRSIIQPVVEIDDDIPLIKGDSALLGQMFNSILDNAIEAMADGGRLKVTVSVPENERVVQVQIIDSGGGIPQDRLDLMFESSLTTKQNGLGIGMMLAKKIADRHGAKISLRSQVGTGTIVTCSFPLD